MPDVLKTGAERVALWGALQETLFLRLMLALMFSATTYFQVSLSRQTQHDYSSRGIDLPTGVPPAAHIRLPQRELSWFVAIFSNHFDTHTFARTHMFTHKHTAISAPG